MPCRETDGAFVQFSCLATLPLATIHVADNVVLQVNGGAEGNREVGEL